MHSAGLNEKAMDLYLRAFYFDTSSDRISEQIIQAALVFQKTGNTEKALQILHSSYMNLPETCSEARIIMMNKVRIETLSQLYLEAWSEIPFFPSIIDTVAKNTMLYIAFSAIMVDQADSAIQMLIRLYPNFAKDRLIQKKFKKIKKICQLNPYKAYNLSLILPGLGQLYAHDYRNSLNSFLLVSGFAILTYSTMIRYTVFDGIISVLPWFARYYRGGAEKAKLAVENYKDKQKKIWLKEFFTQAY